jgi:hypothetical protein
MKSVVSLICDGHVSDKAPVAARINLDVIDVLTGDDYVCLIPQRKDWQVVANDRLNLPEEVAGLLPVECIDRFLQQSIKFFVAVTAPISRRPSLSWNL